MKPFKEIYEKSIHESASHITEATKNILFVRSDNISGKPKDVPDAWSKTKNKSYRSYGMPTKELAQYLVYYDENGGSPSTYFAHDKKTGVHITQVYLGGTNAQNDFDRWHKKASKGGMPPVIKKIKLTEVPHKSIFD